MILIWIISLAAGIGSWYLTESIVIGIIATIMGLGILGAAWNEAGATINMATQKQRDREIINELKKMNGEE